MKKTIDIYLSLITPLNFELKIIKDEFLMAQNALQNLNKFDLKIESTLNALIEVKKLQEIPIDLEVVWKKNKVYLRDENIYHFKIDIDYIPPYYEDLEKDFNINSNDFFVNQILIKDIEKRFYEFLMILNICRVGGYHFGMSFIKNEDEFKLLKKINFYSYELYQYSIEKKWPNFENLDILQTWNWFIEKANVPIPLMEMDF